jgi:hypothetical protein
MLSYVKLSEGEKKDMKVKGGALGMWKVLG